MFTDGNRGYSVGLSFEPDWADVMGLQICTRKWRSERSLAAYPTLQRGHVFHVRAVAVTADGCEVLTDYPRDLIGLG